MLHAVTQETYDRNIRLKMEAQAEAERAALHASANYDPTRPPNGVPTGVQLTNENIDHLQQAVAELTMRLSTVLRPAMCSQGQCGGLAGDIPKESSLGLALMETSGRVSGIRDQVVDLLDRLDL